MLGEDGHGVWLGVPHGTVMRRPGLHVETNYPAVVLVPAGSAYVAMFMDRAPAPGNPTRRPSTST